MSQSQVFTPVVDAEEVYGDGDWRPILGAGPRKEGWKLHMVGKQSIDHKLEGVILPSFDFTLLLDDAAFPTSVGPCWTSTPDKRLPRHFVPNAFALPILMYPYLGEQKEHWVSPFNRKNMIGNTECDPEEFADAFDDLNKWVRRNKGFSDSQRDGLLKGKTMRDDPAVPGRTIRYFSLAECKDKENDWHPAIVGCTGTSYGYMLEQMRWRHEDEGEPRDPDFPRYLLGDPTNPANALVFHADKIQLDAKDAYETNVLCYTRRREYLDENVKTRKISDELIAKRFLMPDPDNWNIPTYEEQVMHMVEHFDARVTIDMIRAACEHRFRGEIPAERPKSVVYSTPSADEEQEERKERRQERKPAGRETSDDGSDAMAAVTGGAMAPQSSAPPMPNPEPEQPATAAPQTDDGTKYWAGKPGAGDPVQLTVTELQAAYDAGQTDGWKVNTEGTTWLLIEECGLVKVKPAAPVVPADAPPTVPSDTAPPQVPADTPPTVPDGEAADGGPFTKEKLKCQMFDGEEGWKSIADEQKDAASKLLDDAWEATGHGADPNLPDEIVNRLLPFLG